eukprot:scaffold1.g5685.t1
MKIAARHTFERAGPRCCSLEENGGLLSNNEVLAVLKAREADKHPSVSKALPSEIKVYSALQQASGPPRSREELQAFIKAVEPFDLTKAEVLQLLNHRPTSEVEIYLCVEQCEERLGEEKVGELLELETLVPVRLTHGCTGVGTVIDPSSDADDLETGTRLELPLWLARGMAQRHMAQVELPVFYGNKMRRKIKAGAGCEDLRVRCPHYYTVAAGLHAAMQASLTADEAFPGFILNTFRSRYRELLTKAPQIESSLEASQVQAKLSVEELALFNEAAEAAADYERWKGCREARPALGRMLSLKRKWGGEEGGAEGVMPAAMAKPRQEEETGLPPVEAIRAMTQQVGEHEALNSHQCSQHCRHASSLSLQSILAGNRDWAEAMTHKDPLFFDRLKNQQAPKWLWIGCSDSRVPANELIGLGPGEVFVQRNVGNLATHKDMNVMSCMEYAVGVLKVKHICVVGHYNCGAVKAALTLPCKTPGLVNLWINDIRDTRNKNTRLLRALKGDAQVNKLVELNVIRQVFNVCTSPIVQQAWDAGQDLAELTTTITSLRDFEEHLAGGAESGPEHDLSVDVLEHFSFEREALRRVSITKDVASEAQAA